MIRTLIVEECSVARLGIHALLDAHPHALDIDEAASRAAMMARVRERYYELIIVEPGFGGVWSAGLLKELCAASPWSEVLVFTEIDELTHGVEAIRDGARGYLMKTCGEDEFRAAVKRVCAGQVYLSMALAAEFAAGLRQYDARSQPHEALGMREFQVFSMAVCGMTLAESAHILQMDTDTARELKRRMMDKLRAGTQQALLDYALAQRLMPACRAACGALWNARFGQDYVASPATRSSMFFV